MLEAVPATRRAGRMHLGGERAAFVPGMPLARLMLPTVTIPTAGSEAATHSVAFVSFTKTSSKERP
jgi:hypothetical protein